MLPQLLIPMPSAFINWIRLAKIASGVFPLRVLPLLLAAVFVSSAPSAIQAAPVQMPRVDDTEAHALAASQAETWRRNIREQKVLLGAGPDGRASFARHAASSDPALQRWRAAAEALAATCVASPIPDYVTPEEIVATGKRTLYQAQEDTWLREPGDELVLLSMVGALDTPLAKSARERLHALVLKLCEYPVWGRNQNGLKNQDLAAAHVTRGIAMAWAWHRDVWSPAEQTQIIDTISERVGMLSALIPTDKIYWTRAYTDNHNQVVNASVGWAGAAFLDDLPSEAPLWFARALLNYRNVARYYEPDGGSPEGVPYWSYGVSFILQYLEGVRGVVDTSEFYDGDWLHNMVGFRLHSSTSGFGGVLPWGDSTSRDFYGPQHILHRLAAQYRSGDAAYLAEHIPYPPQGNADVTAWAWLWLDPSVPATPPATLDHHSVSLDVVSTRSGWSASDHMVSLKFGYTRRNHSHLDAGAIALAFGDEWLITTPGYGQRSGERDFWQAIGPRWDYASNATESHSTLLIGGRNQRFDAAARGLTRTFFSSPSALWVEVDLGEAYADVSSIWRRLLHRRGEYFLIFDDWTLATPDTVEWLLSVPPDAATIKGPLLTVAGRGGSIDVQQLPDDAPAFAPRSMISPKNNVSANRMASFSASSGKQKEGNFRVLIQPRPARVGAVPSVSASRLSLDDEKETWRVQGPGWEDAIAFDRSANAPVRLLVQRSASGASSELIAVGVRQLGQLVPPIQSVLPGDAGLSFAATRDNDALWTLVSDAPPETLRTRLRPASGWRLEQTNPPVWELRRATP